MADHVGVRSTSPANPLEADWRKLAGENATFGWDLFHVLRRPGRSFCISPYSLSTALAMTYAGALGETARQMAKVLRFTLPEERLHQAFQTLNGRLIGQDRKEGFHEEPSGHLDFLNGLWVQRGYPIKPEFMNLLIEAYGASLREADFSAEADQSRRQINRWVSDGTAGRIPELLPPGLIDRMTTLLLTNAIFFRGAWMHAFEPDQTTERQFHIRPGKSVRAPMMRRRAEFAYLRGEGFQAVRLRYSGAQRAMLILLPDEGQFGVVAERLDQIRIAAVLDEIVSCQVNLSMPRFMLRGTVQLRDALIELGLRRAFSSEADFRGISEAGDLFIGDLVHQSYVSVDEAGTEAAAASAVVMPRSIPSGEAVELTLNRPFLFMIYDPLSGAVLYLGQMMDPRLRS